MNESWKHFTPDRIHGEGKKCKIVLIHPVFTMAENIIIIIFFSFSIQDSQEVYLFFCTLLFFFCTLKNEKSIFLCIYKNKGKYFP